MKLKLSTMLALQDAINCQVHPQWQQQGFTWYRAIWVECAELLDHHGWKWWKHQEADVDQVKLELIDIWHFGLSILLIQGVEADAISTALQSGLQSPAGDFKNDLEQFTQNTLATKDFDIPGFARLMQGIDLDFDELYSRYVGKNVLNRFRQDHGYKTGTYEKIWQGREDNEWLVDLCQQLDSDSEAFQQDLYSGLQARYPA